LNNQRDKKVGILPLSNPSVEETSQQLPIERNILGTARGGGMIFAGKIFSYGIRFVIGFILARYLGAADYGLYNLALTLLVVIASFTNLGFSTALVRYISVFVNRNDKPAIWGTLILGVGIPTLLSILACIGLYFLAETVATEIYNEPKLTNLLRIACLIIPFLTFNSMVSSAIAGFNKMEYLVINESVLQPVLRIILLVIFVILGLNAVKAISVYTVTIFVTALSFLFFLNRIFSVRRDPRKANYDPKQLFTFSLPVYFTKTVNTVGGNIQTILLGSFSSLVNVGIFSVTTQVGLIGKLFHESVVSASRPVVSTLFDNNAIDQLRSFYQTTSKWTFTLNLPFFLIVIFFPTEILSIFGESYVGGATALIILGWANLFNTSTGICGAMLDMSGYTKLKLLNSIITMSVTLIINLLLIPIYGLVGAAIAALISIVIINTLRVIEIFVLFRLQPYNVGFLKPIIAGFVSILLSYVFSNTLLPDSSVISILINISLLVLSYFAFILMLGLSAEDRMVLRSVRNRATSMLNRKNSRV
jgi:O-antigen/teichoic acid export membrane protein